MQQLSFLNGLGAVRGLAANLNVLLSLEKHAKDAPNNTAVIRDQDLLFNHVELPRVNTRRNYFAGTYGTYCREVGEGSLAAITLISLASFV